MPFSASVLTVEEPALCDNRYRLEPKPLEADRANGLQARLWSMGMERRWCGVRSSKPLWGRKTLSWVGSIPTRPRQLITT